jgi:hypothetical protein
MTEDKPQDIALLGMQFLENMRPVIEMLNGFRTMLREEGYSEGAAEHMTSVMFT